MNKIDRQLQKIKTDNRLGLMTHVVVGYPSLGETEKLVILMEKTGVDMVELQIPFSDPLADGPTIMRACEESLQRGTKVKDAFIVVYKLSRKITIPLLFMAYYNTVFKYGTEKFCRDVSKAGISGLIVPDIPLEEEHEERFIKYCQEAGLKNIRVISPASTIDRLKKNAKVANGFVYCTARQGITGVHDKLDGELEQYLKLVREHFSIPLAVGFGISKKEHIKALKGHADMVVVGSALIEVINKSKDVDMEKNVRDFLRTLMLH